MPPTRQHPKVRTISMVLKNPEFQRVLKEAWDAPYGSTKREQAKSIMGIISKTRPRFETDEIMRTVNETVVNPWASLPVHRPVLNYAPPAPTRGKKQDGQGGTTSSFNVPILSAFPSGISGMNLQSDVIPLTPQQIAANKKYEEEQALAKQRGLFNAPVANAQTRKFAVQYGPSIPSASSSIIPPATSYGPGVMLADQGTGRSVQDIEADIARQKEAAKYGGLFSVSGDTGKGYTTTNLGTVPSISVKSTMKPESDYLKGTGAFTLPKGVTALPLKESAEAEKAQKRILKGENGKLYAYNPLDKTPIKYIEDATTLGILVRDQGYSDTREPLSKYSNPSTVQTLGAQPIKEGEEKVVVPTGTGATEVTEATETTIPKITVPNINDPFVDATGSLESYKTTGTEFGPPSPDSLVRSTGFGSLLMKYPNLNPNAPKNQGLGMKEYETNVLKTIASDVSNEDWNIAFPGEPKPDGASLVGHIQALIDVKKNEVGLEAKQSKLEQAILENPSVVPDVTDYIISHDKQLKKVDALMADAEIQMARNSDFPQLRDMNANYINYLTTMRGKTVQRYSSYLNKAVDLRNTEVARLQSEVDKALQEVNQAIPLIQAKSEEDYGRIISIIDENWQKPQLAAQAEAQRMKDEADLRKSQIDEMEALANLQTKESDTFNADRSEVEKQVLASDGSWRVGTADITNLIATYAPGNPKAVYEVMAKIMPTSILSEEKNSTTGVVEKGLYNKEEKIKTYEQAIASRYADLKNNELQVMAYEAAATDPAAKQEAGDALALIRKEIQDLKNVQVSVADAVVKRMTENLAGLDEKTLARMRSFFIKTEGRWYLPQAWEKAIPTDFSDAKRGEFIKQFTDTAGSPTIARWIFDMIKTQTMASAEAHNLADKPDARFYFDSQEALGGTQTGATTLSKISDDVSRYVFANFGLANLAAE